MKKKILIIACVIILSVTGCSNNNRSNTSNTDDNKVNSNIGVIEDKTVEVFQFTNASLILKDEKWEFEVTVTNTSDTEQKLSYFVIKFYNEDKVIGTVKVVSTPTLSSHDAISLHIANNEDMSNITKVEYEIER